VTVRVIPTDEEITLFRETRAVIDGNRDRTRLRKKCGSTPL